MDEHITTKLHTRWLWFTVRDLLWLALAVALGLGWQEDHRRVVAQWHVDHNQLIARQNVEHQAAIDRERTLIRAATTSAFQKAYDPQVYWGERIKAASTLSESERALLRDQLTAELPGEWGKKTLDAISVLGAIGNEDTIKALEEIDNMPVEFDKMPFVMPGKIGSVKDSSIERIRKRLSEGK